MANLKISQLTLGTPAQAGDLLPIDRAGVNFAITAASIAALTSVPVASVFGRTGAVVATSGDYTVAQVTGAASLASPTFTGVPAAPTAAINTNTTQLATTAFVIGQGYVTGGPYLPLAGGTMTGVLTSSVSTGTAPFVIASTTNVANLNASSLGGATFSAPGPIGSTTASTGTFSSISVVQLISTPAASLRFSPGNGITQFFDGTNQETLQIWSGGTLTTVIASAGTSYLSGGNLGVGNTNPLGLFSVGSSSQFQVDVNGNVILTRVSKAGADFAGQATITASTTTKAVAFAANYTGTGQPVIVLTPTSDPLALGVPVGYWVTYSGSAGAWTGFTVNIQTALAGNVTFNYLVVGQA